MHVKSNIYRAVMTECLTVPRISDLMMSEKKLGKQARKVIRNVYACFDEEKKRGRLSTPLSAPVYRTAAACGVSTATVSRISHGQLDPGSSRKVRKDRIVLDSFDLGVIRRCIQTMYERKKLLPTLKNIREELNGVLETQLNRSTLAATLRSLGFRYKRCMTDRKILMERPGVIQQRSKFLRAIRTYRREGRPIVYLDETFVHSSHAASFCWQHKDWGLKIPFSKGERMVIAHAGTKDGFIEGGLLVFKEKSASGDYHSEMNAENFKRWLNEKIIPNLPSGAVLVMDNASYHNIQVDRCPTQSSRKADIQAYLQRQSIPFPDGALKVELLHLCQLHKPEPVFNINRILQQHGHAALRLPPYHPDLNPIEMIWSQLKGFIAKRNLNFKLAEVKQLINEGVEHITKDNWTSCCAHVERTEQDYWAIDIAKDEEVMPVIINFDSDSDVSSDEMTDSASETGETTYTADEAD